MTRTLHARGLLFLSAILALPQLEVAGWAEDGSPQACPTGQAVAANVCNDLDYQDAAQLLQGTTRDGRISQEAIQEVVTELKALRAQAPEIAQIHHYAPAPKTLSITLNAIALSELIAGNPEVARAISRPDAHDTGDRRPGTLMQYRLKDPNTGLRDLDQLDRRYGAESVTVSIYPGLPAMPDSRNPATSAKAFLEIDFAQLMDIETLSDRYESLLRHEVVSVTADGAAGDGDKIYRFAKKGEAVHYLFLAGSGDCPAGCTEITPYRFNLVTPEQAGGSVPAGERVIAVENPHERGSLWGYPVSFDLPDDATYANLMAQAAGHSSGDWSDRVQAVTTLGRLLVMGADAYPADDARQVARAAEVAKDAQTHRTEVDAELKHLASSDSDCDVKRAARRWVRETELKEARDAVVPMNLARYQAGATEVGAWEYAHELRYPAPWWERIMGLGDPLQREHARLLRASHY